MNKPICRQLSMRLLQLSEKMIASMDQGFDNIIKVDNMMINDLRMASLAIQKLIEHLED